MQWPDLSDGDQLAWAVHDNRVVYIAGGSVLVLSLDGGDPTLVAPAPPEAHSFAWSPAGERLVYVRGNQAFASDANIAPSSIWIMGVNGDDDLQVTEDASLNTSPVWMPDGRHIMFVSNRDGARDIYIVRVGGTGRPRGAPQRVTVGLDPHSISVSADGSTLAYSRFAFRRNVWEVAFPATGSVSLSEARPVTVGNQTVEQHGLSRDGRWLAYDSDQDGNQDIYVVSVELGEPRRLTRDPGADFHPDFSGDGSEIVFYSLRHGSRDLFLISADGRNEVRLTDDPGQELHPALSADGLRIAFQADAEIQLMSREAVGLPWRTPRQLAPFGSHPRWSPEGRRIVYEVDNNTIRVVSLVGEEQRWLDGIAIGLIGPYWPEWSRDGRSVYFIGGDSLGSRALYAMPAGGGQPRKLIRFDDPTRHVHLAFSVGDGKVYVSVAEYESDVYVMDLEMR
jgi:TolB protein